MNFLTRIHLLYLPIGGILLCLLATATFGQSVKIGNVTFDSLREANKPAETLHAVIEVFEDNVNNKGRKINLNVEVVPAKDRHQKTAPMFIVMGGPGQAATDFVSFFSDIFQTINETSDLIFIDQRGTGKSNPIKLRGTVNTFQDYFEDDFLADKIISDNYAAISKINNVKCFGTLNAILDIEYVRKQLGYESINLYGTSYGTRVVISYINRFPKAVRTATLKGVVPPDLIMSSTFAEDAQRSLDLMIRDCRETERCHAAYPTLQEEVDRFVNSRFPLQSLIANPETGLKDTIEMTKGVVMLSLRLSLMALSSTKNIPYVITQANRQNYEPLANIVLSTKKAYLRASYDGLTLCVICFEDYPRLLSLDKLSKGFLGTYWMDRIKNACSIWNPDRWRAPPLPAKSQKTPVLLISGNRDGATPPQYGEEVLKYFPSGRHVVVQQGSHSFDGMRNCVEKLICDFVIAGTAASLNADCVETIKFPPYKVE